MINAREAALHTETALRESPFYETLHLQIERAAAKGLYKTQFYPEELSPLHEQVYEDMLQILENYELVLKELGYYTTRVYSYSTLGNSTLEVSWKPLND